MHSTTSRSTRKIGGFFFVRFFAGIRLPPTWRARRSDHVKQYTSPMGVVSISESGLLNVSNHCAVLYGILIWNTTGWYDYNYEYQYIKVM